MPRKHKTPKWFVLLLGVASAASWGFAAVLGKSSLEVLPPMQLLVIQLVASNLLLALLVLVRRPALPPRKEALIFAAVGLLQPGLSSILATIGLSMTTVTSETLIWSSETLMILVISWALLKEPVSRKLWGLALLATAGMILVAAHADESSSRSSTGDFLILLGTMCSSLDVVVTRNYVEKIDPLWAIALGQLTGLGVSLFAATASAPVGGGMATASGLSALKASGLVPVSLAGAMNATLQPPSLVSFDANPLAFAGASSRAEDQLQLQLQAVGEEVGAPTASYRDVFPGYVPREAAVQGRARLVLRRAPLGWKTWFLSCASGLLQHAIPFWLYTIVLNHLEAKEASFFLALVPVFGIAGAMIFLGERLTAIQMLGTAVILVAMVGVVRLHEQPHHGAGATQSQARSSAADRDCSEGRAV